MSVNKNFFVGRVGHDPQVNQINDNFKVAKCGLALDESYKDKNGNKVDKTEWINLVAHNQKAELFEKYVRKGDLIHVECKVQTRSWEKDGEKRYATEFVVMAIEFLQSKNTSQGTSNDIADLPNGVDQDKGDLPI